MNNQFVYFNKNIVVSDENGSLSEAKPFLNNTNEILKLENEKEKLEKRNDVLNEEKYNALRRKSKNSKGLYILELMLSALVTPTLLFLAQVNFSSITVKSMATLGLIEGIVTFTGVFFFSLEYFFQKIHNKLMDEIVEKNIEEIIHNSKQIKKIANKIKVLEEDKTTSNIKYNDYDVIDVNTNKVVKSRILKK